MKILKNFLSFKKKITTDPPIQDSSQIINLSADELEIETYALSRDYFKNKDYELALTLISRKVIEFSTSYKFLGKKIYLPLLDDLIVEISNEILKDYKNVTDIIKKSNAIKVPLILATELYSDGGHSRIVEEICKIHPDTIIILTNSFEGSDRENRPTKSLKNLRILALPESKIVENIKRLNSICRTIGSKVYHLGHHHDTTLNAALVNLEIPVYFMHHSDHKPSLGNTISSFSHVDMSPHVHRQCNVALEKKPFFWPQGVSDMGIKKFHYPLSHLISACSGNHTKFNWDGELAYPKLVCAILKTNTLCHYHIGSITEEQYNKVNLKLIENNIPLDKFKLIGSVESLWATLLELPINCFIGSAPIHGLRTSIEVQGAGIPILPFRQSRNLPIMLDDGHYNNEALYWSTLDNLQEQMAILKNKHQIASVCARKFYENNFSINAMKEAMNETDIFTNV